MKYIYSFIVFCFLLLLISACASQKKIDYIIPSDLNDYDKKNLLASLETGKLLYKDHCSTCHGIFSAGKNDVPDFSVKALPDFTKIKMDRYLLRIFMTDPVSHKAVLKMGKDEISLIMSFLTHYKVDEAQAK